MHCEREGGTEKAIQVHSLSEIFIYGIIGYTRVSIVPFYTDVVKVENDAYYKYISKDIEPRKNSDIDELRHIYRSNIQVYKNFNNLSKKDINVFTSLYKEGDS